MTDLRSHVVFKKALTAKGLPLDDDVYLKKKLELKRELESDIPSLKTLQASTLHLLLSSVDSQLILAATLKEVDQMALRDPKNGQLIYDPFLEDIRRVKADQADLELRLVSAQSPAAAPQQDEAVQRIRRRLRNAHRRKEPTLWTNLNTWNMPLFLPNSPTSNAPIRVLGLTPTQAIVELCEDVQLPEADRQLIERGTRLNLLRPEEYRTIAAGSVLQNAMDSAATLQLRFAIVLRWDTGDVSHLELLSFEIG